MGLCQFEYEATGDNLDDAETEALKIQAENHKREGEFPFTEIRDRYSVKGLGCCMLERTRSGNDSKYTLRISERSMYSGGRRGDELQKKRIFGGP